MDIGHHLPFLDVDFLSFLIQMTKKIKKLEKETGMWKSRWENSTKALLEMAEEVRSGNVMSVIRDIKYGASFALFGSTPGWALTSEGVKVIKGGDCKHGSWPKGLG